MNSIVSEPRARPQTIPPGEPDLGPSRIVVDAHACPTAGQHSLTSHWVPVKVESLRVWSRLSQDLYDEGGVLLLAAGHQVTPRFLQLLSTRGIQVLHTAPQKQQAQVDTSVSIHSQKLDAMLTQAMAKYLPNESGALPHTRNLSPHDLDSEARRGCQKHGAAGAMLADLCATISGGQHVSGYEIRRTVRGFSDMLTLDMDLLPLVVGMQRERNEYLFNHCVNTAMLSMMMAAHMGFDYEQVMEVGLGAMFQDVGMLRVPKEIRLAPRALRPDEWFEVQRHPIYTIECLERIDSIPTAAQFVGYQVHERSDGSGYPRHRSGLFIHQCAKIVAVADSYAAMTKARPHRHPVMPYEAAKTVLFDGSHGKFDLAVVRAFLDCVSLFPIGSGVVLSDGTTARVLRANAGKHTRPVVEQLSPQGQPTGQLIDLSQADELKVVSAFTYMEST